MKHYITDEDINRVSIKNLPYHDENTCKGIEAYCQYLLDCSKCYNNSNECDILLDIQDLSKYNLYKGDEHNVTAKINCGRLRMKQSNSPINTSKILDYMKELTIKEKINTLRQVDICYYRRYSK